MTSPTKTKRINCAALRTLHELELALQRHIRELMALGCVVVLAPDGNDAAEAIVFAIEAAEKAIDKTRARLREVAAGQIIEG